MIFVWISVSNRSTPAFLCLLNPCLNYIVQYLLHQASTSLFTSYRSTKYRYLLHAGLQNQSLYILIFTGSTPGFRFLQDPPLCSLIQHISFSQMTSLSCLSQGPSVQPPVAQIRQSSPGVFWGYPLIQSVQSTGPPLPRENQEPFRIAPSHAGRDSVNIRLACLSVYTGSQSLVQILST